MAFKNEPFKFEIVKKIAVLSEEASGWAKELNLVSFNGAPPKYDIRSWDADHEKMGKGITLSEEEMALLKEAVKGLEIN